MQFFSPPISVYKTSCKSLPTSFRLIGLQLLYQATRSSTDHHIFTKPGQPIFAKSHRLNPTKLAVAKAEFSDKAGITRRSTSPRASPLHMVKKKDGGWKPCGHIVDFTLCVIDSTVFSKLD